MLAGLTAFLIALIIFVMATLGCVLLVAFTMRKASARARITVAALSGPGLMIAPVMLLAAADGSSGAATVLGFAIIGLIACAGIGWPVAHVATRRLDRLIQFDVDTFE